MTRINLVPPEELTDQHLFAEFREIKMVPKALARSLKSRGTAGVLMSIPAKFTLNAGHVLFFYDKGAYLAKRYEQIKKELDRRGVNYNKDSLFDAEGTILCAPWFNDWVPDEEAFRLIRQRIDDKIQLKPDWYKYKGMTYEQKSI